MTFKTIDINKKDFISTITNLYEIMTIILMEGEIKGTYTTKECNMRTEIISMSISRVLIELFKPDDVMHIFKEIQKKLDDEKRSKKRIKKIKTKMESTKQQEN